MWLIRLTHSLANKNPLTTQKINNKRSSCIFFFNPQNYQRSINIYVYIAHNRKGVSAGQKITVKYLEKTERTNWSMMCIIWQVKVKMIQKLHFSVASLSRYLCRSTSGVTNWLWLSFFFFVKCWPVFMFS